jgi:hypothetical protein
MIEDILFLQLLPANIVSLRISTGAPASAMTGQITHHIGPDLDAERELVIGDLNAAGQISMQI